MGQDTGQIDISDRQLLTSSSQAKASEWTDIGQAEVFHTIFGKAKVRIVRKNDKMRRVLYWLAIIAIVSIAGEAWFLFQRPGIDQVESFPPRLNTKSDMSEPISKPESSTILSVKNTEKNEDGNSSFSNKNKPDQTSDSNDSIKINTKPITHRPLRSVVPQSAPIAAAGDVLPDQTDKSILPQQAQKQPVDPIRRVMQTGASSPAAASPIVPQNKEGASLQTTSDIQLADPLNSKR